MQEHRRVHMFYIYIYMVTPPTTRTPLKNHCKYRYKSRFLPNPILELFLQIGNTSVKHKNPKKVQDSVDVKSFGFLGF